MIIKLGKKFIIINQEGTELILHLQLYTYTINPFSHKIGGIIFKQVNKREKMIFQWVKSSSEAGEEKWLKNFQMVQE